MIKFYNQNKELKTFIKVISNVKKKFYVALNFMGCLSKTPKLTENKNYLHYSKLTQKT